MNGKAEKQGPALIIGAGAGLSASLARLFSSEGYAVVLAARNAEKLSDLATETGATAHACDASDADDVARLFSTLSAPPSVVVYNAAGRVRGPLVDLDPQEVRRSLDVSAFGGFLVGQAAARQMLGRGEGTILFTGASAGLKGFPRSAPFAMGKFALRGLAQSMARELHPQGIHVAYVNIDGQIRNPGRVEPADRPQSMLDPDAIARAYLMLVGQDRSTWSEELNLRPWVETF